MDKTNYIIINKDLDVMTQNTIDTGLSYHTIKSQKTAKASSMSY